jgi:hypothetical protein
MATIMATMVSTSGVASDIATTFNERRTIFEPHFLSRKK